MIRALDALKKQPISMVSLNHVSRFLYRSTHFVSWRLDDSIAHNSGLDIEKTLNEQTLSIIDRG
jgi:hypothetical protein